MNARERSMAAHPAGKGIPRTPDRIQALIDAAQDEQALELANRGHADLEVWAGGPMRRINEKHHEVSTGPHGRWLDVLVPLVIALVIFGVVCGSAFLGVLVGGWPA